MQIYRPELAWVACERHLPWTEKITTVLCGAELLSQMFCSGGGTAIS